MLLKLNSKVKKNTCLWICIFNLIVLGVCIENNSWADQKLPATIDPGRVDKKYEPPLTPLSIPEAPLTIRHPKRLPIKDAEKIRFILKEVRLEGNTVYTQSQLMQFYDTPLNTKVSLADIYNVTDKITAHYRNDGYILSQAIIPVQTITDGKITLQIIEGFVDDVEISGDIQGSVYILEAFGEKITESRPLKNEVFERYALFANDLFGAKVKAILRPSKNQPGAATVVFTTEHTHASGSVGIHNRGTDSVGPLEVVGSLNLNSSLGLYEQISAVLVITTDYREQKYAALTYKQPVGTEGAVVSLSANMNRSEPDGQFMRLTEVETESENYKISYEYPHIRTRKKNLRSRISFEHRKSKTQQLNQVSALDKIRVLTAGATYDFVDKANATNLLDLSISQGLDILDATKTGSDNLSRSDGRSDFTKLNIMATRSQPLSNKWGLQFGMIGQYSFSDLLSSQEFGFGGAQYGRAYDSSEITGDHGIAFKTELQYAQQSQLPFLNSWQLYSFYDIGKVWQLSSLPGEESNESAASAGLGFRFNSPFNISGSLEMAVPLTRPVAAESPGGKDPRFFFNLNSSF
ncbi:MAG: ShlB/FhaC/HecB family hemolysin secretion/activation protein [Desulfobacter sp.]|nr:MAG: ShlB/FhaC/HecB family hemolysin secretion/activation protein [Desulfobacter sp.]